MAQPTPAPRTRRPNEQLLDEMVEESFPASDAPQLTGRADAERDGESTPSPERTSARAETAHGTPSTIGNQGAIPQSRIAEETVPLDDLGVVTLRFDGELRRLHIYLGEEGMALDAKALDRLIEVLSAKRSQMKDT
jgi:hypothetical protein